MQVEKKEFKNFLFALSAETEPRAILNECPTCATSLIKKERRKKKSPLSSTVIVFIIEIVWMQRRFQISKHASVRA